MLQERGLNRLIERGVDQNCIAYDSQAKPGELTIRLLLLMQALSIENYGSQLYQFYIPDSIEKPFNEEACDLLWPRKELNKGGSLMIYYLNELGATLAHGDQYLIVGTGEGVVVLGSF